MTLLTLTSDEAALTVERQTVKRPPFWIEDGQYCGEGIEAFPVGLCTCCGWRAPLWNTGDNACCLLCHPANKKQRQSGAALQCEMFCEDPVPLPVLLRADPGGAPCCASCQSKVAAIVQQRRQSQAA